MRSKGKIDAFKTSAEYEELLSSTLTHADLQMEHIKDVVTTYFRYVMLWEGKVLLRHIQDKAEYELTPVGGIAKLQSSCEAACRMGHGWIHAASIRLSMSNCNNRSTPCLSGIAIHCLPLSTCRIFYLHRSLARWQGVLGIRESGRFKSTWLQKSSSLIKRIGPYISAIVPPIKRIPSRSCRR